MKFEQPASQGRPVIANPPNREPGEGADGAAPEAVPPGGVPVTPDPYYAVAHELLAVLRKLADEPKPSGRAALFARLKSFFAHPIVVALVIALVTFLLTVLLGGYLTYKYTLSQQEVAGRRSFTDELNKIRVQKIGEVWEHIDRTEVELDALLHKANQGEGSGEKDMDNIVKLFEEDVAIVNKNRFWLGENNYGRLESYLMINRSYALDKLLGRPGIDLSDTLKKREQAKQDVLQIRNMFLKGELEP